LYVLKTSLQIEFCKKKKKLEECHLRGANYFVLDFSGYDETLIT
jgi:hypothetical protein